MDVRADYLNSKGDSTAAYPLHAYVCTVGIGFFAFQVVLAKSPYPPRFAPLPGFENISVPLWPTVLPGFVWPIPGLRSSNDFIAYANRWREISHF
jgi:hypothetical protein